MPTPPPTVTIEPSGSSTVLWWPRPTCIEESACQPAEGFASSKISVVGTAMSVVVEVMVGGAEPPSCITRVDPSVPPGTSTPVPQSRSRELPGKSCQVKLFVAPGGLNDQLSSGNGPATSVRPEGIANMCG